MNRTNELFNIFKGIRLDYDTINIIIEYEKQIIMNLSRKYHINISPIYDNLKNIDYSSLINENWIIYGKEIVVPQVDIITETILKLLENK